MTIMATTTDGPEARHDAAARSAYPRSAGDAEAGERAFAPTVRRRRPATGAPGAKLVISTLAIVATLAGWARLATRDSAADVAAGQDAPFAAVAEAPSVRVNLEPMPTLVPLVDPPAGGFPIPVVPAPVVAPVQELPPASSLRLFVPPQAPVAVSRSSR
jgi:hypothetical protein